MAELGRRLLDGYRVVGLRLVKNVASTDLTWSDGGSTEALLRTIKLDIDADSAWFYDRPQPMRGTSPDWADQRRIAVDPAANYIWNDANLGDPGLQAYLKANRTRLNEIFTFHSPSGEPFPSYRLYPGVESGFGFTNRFGWRSREISTRKPADVIRIAMLGDSTTNAYPAMVEHWLNLWAAQRGLGVHFEVIHAARPASGALDAAAIFDFELGTVDPDYVILYGYGNGIYVADALIKLPPGLVKGQPSSAGIRDVGAIERLRGRISETLEPLGQWSAAATFLRARALGQRGGKLSPEPPKPLTRLEFPQGIDERSPDPDKIAGYSNGGLMGLDVHLRGLNKISAMAKDRDIRVFVSTFRIMAFDGMLLGKGDPANGGIIYSVINQQYWWPYTYAQIRRLTSFYNRTLQAWAKANGQFVLPIDEQMPWRPELYGDGMHELPQGEALHAWVALQQLMPRVRADLAMHRLPRPSRPPFREVSKYWDIGRTSVEAAIAGAGDNVPSPPSKLDSPLTNSPGASLGPADEIAGAFLLSRIAVAGPKAEIVPGDIPLIKTAPEPFAYAAAIPAEASMASRLTGKGWVNVRIRVNEGSVSIGVLNKSAQKFLASSNLGRAPQLQEVTLIIDDLSEVGSLMISNNRPGETARSVAELHGVELHRSRR